MSKHRHETENSRDKTAASQAPTAASDAQPSAPPNASATTPGVAAASQAAGAQAAKPEKASGQAADAQPSVGLVEELEATRKELAALKAEVEELNAKYLRKLAEEVNFRKRMLREKEDGQKYALSSILTDLIPVLDDFDRGMKAAAAAHSFESLNEGMALVHRQLSQMLENKYALKRFESVGSPFDPNRHEALFAEPADVEEAMVSEEYLPGYAHNDRVLRSAKVRVKIPGGAQKPAQTSEGEAS